MRAKRRRQDVDDGAHRHVVDDDRQVDRVADRLEVEVEALLRRLVVVAGRVQHGVGAGLLGEAGEHRSLRRSSSSRRRR